MQNYQSTVLSTEFLNAGNGRGARTILQVSGHDKTTVHAAAIMPDGKAWQLVLDQDGETELDIPKEATIMARAETINGSQLIVGEANE